MPAAGGCDPLGRVLLRILRQSRPRRCLARRRGQGFLYLAARPGDPGRGRPVQPAGQFLLPRRPGPARGVGPGRGRTPGQRRIRPEPPADPARSGDSGSLPHVRRVVRPGAPGGVPAHRPAGRPGPGPARRFRLCDPGPEGRFPQRHRPGHHLYLSRPSGSGPHPCGRLPAGPAHQRPRHRVLVFPAVGLPAFCDP